MMAQRHNSPSSVFPNLSFQILRMKNKAALVIISFSFCLLVHSQEKAEYPGLKKLTVLKKSFLDGRLSNTVKTITAFDREGFLVSKILVEKKDTIQNSSYKYDAKKNVTEIKERTRTRETKQYEEGEFTTITDNVTLVKNTYNRQNGLIRAERTSTTFQDGKKSYSSSHTSTFQLQYNDKDSLTMEESDGSVTHYFYGPFGRIKVRSIYQGDSSVLNFRYDDQGRVTLWQNIEYNVDRNHIKSKQYSYSYGPGGRLKREFKDELNHHVDFLSNGEPDSTWSLQAGKISYKVHYERGKVDSIPKLSWFKELREYWVNGRKLKFNSSGQLIYASAYFDGFAKTFLYEYKNKLLSKISYCEGSECLKPQEVTTIEYEFYK
jgi:hypothetical protein